ncbi:DUF134 domain-containing protein [Candidatus Pacearchaeota archaeon]|nr:DUF134 domain-containing protein [Candidatus Pacearchaeota archaeon]
MPRPRRFRRIQYMPEVNYFKPAGIPMANLNEVVLTVSEYEAIRLVDLEGIPQNKAGKKMKVSQPTFSRILKSARKKLSEAVVKGMAIKIKGGKYKMVQRAGAGKGRGLRRRAPAGGRGRMGGSSAGPGGKCKCPKCGHEEPQTRGQPCMNKKCPKCGKLMTRA